MAIRRTAVGLVSTVLVVTSLSWPAHGAVWYVWATTLDDIEIDVRSAGRQIENAVWRGRRVQLAVDQSGWAGCQLVIEGDEAGAKQLVARGPELWLEQGSANIRRMSSDRSDALVGFGTRVSFLADSRTRAGTGIGDADLVTALPRRGRLRLRLDVRVPQDQPPGLYRGGLVLDADRQRVLVPVDLRVLPRR